LIIRLIIQTIQRDPSGPVWIEDAPNVSRPDPSEADQVDAERQATDLAVGSSTWTFLEATGGTGANAASAGGHANSLSKGGSHVMECAARSVLHRQLVRSSALRSGLPARRTARSVGGPSSATMLCLAKAARRHTDG
jgi:hypothetical protein